METLRIGSRGPNVKLIQSLLSKIGYNPGIVDGVFGVQTQQAAAQFQRDNGLFPDGVIGPATWNAFDRILRGYDVYTVKAGDTIYDIANSYYTTINSVLTANPDLNANALTAGQRIIVPYGIPVVFTDVDYTYEIMERNIRALKSRYPFIEIGAAGQSVMGKNLYYVRLGRGPRQVFYNGSHHANEWITSLLLMKFVENFSRAYSEQSTIRGYNVSNIWNTSSIYIMPMVNPDGVDLVNNWPIYTNPVYKRASQLNKTGLPLPRVWKANIRGVDLNLNYPARWAEAQKFEFSQGVTGPGPSNYGGPAPLSEPESSAVVGFTRNHDFRLVIAYHTQGEVIYWQYRNLAPPEALPIARQFSRASGYSIALNPGEASDAGFKDWFIQQYRRPGYTIEVGRGIPPLPLSQFGSIYNKNEEIMLLAPLL